MRALSLALSLVVISGCGPDLQLSVTPRDGGLQPVGNFKGEEAPTYDASLFTSRFIRLECAVVFCSKLIPKMCFCSTEELCMREAHEVGVPARGCNVLPWPQLAPNYYGIGFKTPLDF